jgi:ribulose-phosphate 3-epimerase
MIHNAKMKAGIAISPDTPSTAITDEIGNAVDLILVMTVYPGQWTSWLASTVFDWRAGRGGQKFIERCVPKVSELRARFPDQNIEVDGGVGPSNVGVCAHAGSSPISLISLCLSLNVA